MGMGGPQSVDLRAYALQGVKVPGDTQEEAQAGEHREGAKAREEIGQRHVHQCSSQGDPGGHGDGHEGAEGAKDPAPEARGNLLQREGRQDTVRDPRVRRAVRNLEGLSQIGIVPLYVGP